MCDRLHAGGQEEGKSVWGGRRGGSYVLLCRSIAVVVASVVVVGGGGGGGGVCVCLCVCMCVRERESRGVGRGWGGEGGEMNLPIDNVILWRAEG